jgi:superfamily I DNA/RNA helicase
VDALLGVCEFLPKLTCDVLLALADGHTPEDVWSRIVAGEQADSPVDTEDYEAAQARPATQETFVVSADAEELEQSLLRPFSEWRIFLHPTQRALAYRAKPYNGPVRVTGGPGTGKTVVAVHRVKALADRLGTAAPTASAPHILLTTFTTTLADQLESLLKDLGGQELLDEVAVRNIDKVAMSVAGLPGTTALQTDDKLLGRWQELLAEQPAGVAARWDARFLHGEWSHVALAQGIETREEYFAARRLGRGRRVNRGERAEIWSLIEAFERRLEQDRVLGFKQLAARAARIAERGLEPRHQYAHIVVDEAQDLHAAHWRLLRALSPIGPDDMFITGDTHQRIYENKVTLGSLGIDIRGRSHKLTLNYRTTRQILGTAAQLLGAESFDDLDGGSDDLAGYRSVLTGRDAEIAGYRDDRAELAALIDRVRTWREHGISASDIVVVARTATLCDSAVSALESAQLPAIRVRPHAKPPAGERVHVMTMHRIKGLEYRAVAVIGAGTRLLPLPAAITSAAVDAIQHAQDIRGERSLLFVAATRAREHLALTWNGEASPFLAGIA